MSKINKNHNRKSHMEETVMQKIKSGQIEMKPKWFFVLGSAFATVGLISFAIGAVFLINLTVFLIRKKGPGIGRLNFMLESFPLWIPLFAVLGIVLGVWLLKKYDFSYKKNFRLIIAGFIASILLAAFAIDYLGLNEIWSKGGAMRKFYQRIENGQNLYFDNRAKGIIQNNRKYEYNRN